MNNELRRTKIDDRTGIEYHLEEITIYQTYQYLNKKKSL